MLVTGGAGFIGSHLCERLVRDGHRVISLDNYFTGSRDNHVPGVDYREGHTRDIEKHVSETPDLIYHLGEYSRVHKSVEEPDLVWDMNINGTQAVLEFWRKKGGKLVYAASSTKSASTETVNGVSGKDMAPYTWAKAANVELIQNYGRWYGLTYAIVYFYNVYGPRERAWGNYGTVVQTFLNNVSAGVPHKVNKPGTQTRAFTHVLDTIDGIILAGEKGENDEFNISSDNVHSIIEVAQMCGGAIEMHPQTKVSRSSGVDDSSKIRELGWNPVRTLKQYVEEAKRTPS
jgi:UDP-glucose 4-epimerase